jgi:hypothetical protein
MSPQYGGDRLAASHDTRRTIERHRALTADHAGLPELAEVGREHTPPIAGPLTTTGHGTSPIRCAGSWRLGEAPDLALDNTSDWIGPNGLVARRAVDANGDGRDEGFITSTGGASNDAYYLFVLSGCHLRQVHVAANGPLRVLVGASVGHAEGFDCQGTAGHGRRLLTLWSVQRADQQPDGGSAHTYTKASYRWVGAALVRQVDTDRGGFGTLADGPTAKQSSTSCRPSSPPGAVEAPGSRAVRTGRGNRTWQSLDTSVAVRCHSNLRIVRRSDELDASDRATKAGR